MPMILPRPPQVGQAPSGELKLNRQRRIEAEQVFVRIAKCDAVQFETVVEELQRPVLRGHGHPAVSAGKGVRDRREQARTHVAFRSVGQTHPVQQQPGAGQRVRTLLQHLVDLERFPVSIEAVVAVFLELQEQLHAVRAGIPAQIGQHVVGPPPRSGQPVQHVRHGIPAHFLPGHGRESPPDTGEYQPQEIIDLRGRGDGRTGVAGADFLLDGDGRRDAVDAVHVRFGHPAEELACVRGKALRETALPLRVERVEGQRRFPRSGNARDDHELSAGNPQGQILEIVDPGAFDFDAFFHLCLGGSLFLLVFLLQVREEVASPENPDGGRHTAEEDAGQKYLHFGRLAAL